jgi:adenylate cyclase
MDNVFASITSGVITTDTEEQITLFNRAAERVLRVPSTAIVGSRLSDTLPALAEALTPIVDQVKRYGEPVVEFENEIFLPGSGQVHLRTSLSPLKNANEETQGTAIVIDDLTEQRRLESRYQLFQRYLPPAVIERLPNDPHELRLGGQRQEITSLFADIRGFTNFSRQHDPETLVEVLNKYLAVGAQAVLDEEGTLDKIMGDCIVAFFNAPLTQSDHILRAVRAALKIREGIARLHEDVPASYRLNYGVGINVGDAVVGNVGTAQQMNYTAIGSGVNLASRLQEAAAPGQILLPQATYQRVQKYVEARLLSPITVAGFSEPIVVYELLEWRS